MKQVLISNIMNLEDYLLTVASRKTFAYFDSLPIKELWVVHNDLVGKLKEVDE